MSITVTPFGGNAKEWDAFVGSSRNGTFFHTRKFLSYHPDDRFVDASLLFFEEHKLLGVLPAAEKKEDGKKMLVSHPGATYGGLVIDAKAGMREAGEMLDALKTYAKEKKYDRIAFLRLTLPILRKRSSDDQEFWLFRHGWTLNRMELSTSYVLSDLKTETVLDSFDRAARNKVRQSEKSGLEVKWTEDFPEFWKLLEKTLAERHEAKPTHTLEEITRLHEIAPKDVRLLGAYEGKDLVAGFVVISIHAQALYILYTGQNYEKVDLKAVPLLLSSLFTLAIGEGRRVLDFGISTEDGGTKVNDNLFQFKESFGGQSVRRESWMLDL
jgi:hypothetical protein